MPDSDIANFLHQSRPPATVYLVDEDRVMLESLSFFLIKAGLHCITFDDSREFLNSVPMDGVGCVILEQSMAKMSGITLMRELLARKYDHPIIFLTGCGTVAAAVEAMQLGAFDFLERPIENQRILEVVKRSLDFDEQRYSKIQSTELLESKIQSLTSRQKEVMDCIVEGLLSKQIAKKLQISIKTVEVHRSQLAKKLGVSSLASLVQLLTMHKIKKEDVIK